MDDSSETVSFEVERIEAETDKAILVDFDGEKTWVPKSQIHDDSEVWSKENDSGTLIVTRWWATKNGLV